MLEPIKDLKAAVERDVLVSVCEWLGVTEKNAVQLLDKGPTEEPPDGWILRSDKLVWIEVVSVTINKDEAKELWDDRRNIKRASGFSTETPDIFLSIAICEQAINKFKKESYKQIADKFGGGVLAINIDSPLGWGDSFWDALRIEWIRSVGLERPDYFSEVIIFGVDRIVSTSNF